MERPNCCYNFAVAVTKAAILRPRAFPPLHDLEAATEGDSVNADVAEDELRSSVTHAQKSLHTALLARH